MNLIKKVPDLTFWLPTQSNIWIPSHYRISPHPVLASENELLMECLNEFVHPPDYETNPYWRTPIGQCLTNQRYIVCGEFIRKTIHKDFEDWKMPRKWHKTVKAELNSQAELMKEIWCTVCLLPLPQNPRPLVFLGILLEGALIFFNAMHEKEGENIGTATDIVKKQQRINKDLQSLSNPFKSTSSPKTWSFIEECQQSADRSKNFYSIYMKLVQARMSLLSKMRKSLPKKIDKMGRVKEKRGRKSLPKKIDQMGRVKEKRGRKPIPSSRSLSG